jgi:cleavage and polyadenylation specificity factor subunit 2
MGRVACLDQVEAIRAEEEVAQEPDPSLEQSIGDIAEQPTQFIASTKDVREAFDSINPLRYSQPTHLQGIYFFLFLVAI